MQKAESQLYSYEEKRKKVSQFNLTSDIFFSKVMEDKQACQELIQILTGEALVVKIVKSQYSIRNLENHSVTLDVLTESQKGRMINVEIHTQEDEDHVRRGRYYISSIDVSILEKGTDYEELPDVYLIYITDKDFIGQNRAIYVVKRVVQENLILNNGIYEFYVNLKGKTDSSEQRELLDFIVNSKSNYKTDAFPNLARRVTMFKEDRKGVDIMCEILERERTEGRLEGRLEGILEGKTEEHIAMVRKKYQKGNKPEQAAEALELDTEYVRNIMDMMELQNLSDEEIVMKLIKEQE